ncbi:MAG: DUF4115 domain-containing protein [Chlorobiaceae bacterium]|nr:DUF4115 domain-containing protein [Chlorobiaceae bacterium]
MNELVSSSAALERLVTQLKHARKERELSLEDVSRQITVPKGYLEKIEGGDFSFLPKVYIFTFIKEYALLMGVGEEETLEQCRKELQLSNSLKRDVAGDGNSVREKRPKSDVRFRPPLLSLVWKIGSVVIVLAGLALVYSNGTGLFSAQHSSAPVPLPSTTIEDTVAVAEPIVDSLVISGGDKSPSNVASVPSEHPSPAHVDSAVAAVTPAAPAASSKPPTVPALSEVSANGTSYREWAKHVSFLPVSKSSPYQKVLVVHVIDDYSWVKVIADDSARVYPGGQFKNGEVLRFEARNKLWVNIGRPKYVELYLNGKKLPPSADRTLIIN